MKKWIVKRTIEYEALVEAGNRNDAREMFSEIDARFIVRSEVIRPASEREITERNK